MASVSLEPVERTCKMRNNIAEREQWGSRARARARARTADVPRRERRRSRDNRRLLLSNLFAARARAA